jgi:hypothetical protein
MTKSKDSVPAPFDKLPDDLDGLDARLDELLRSRSRFPADVYGKLVDDCLAARFTRLIPVMAALGLHAENRKSSLEEFLNFEERTTATALPSLLDILRFREKRLGGAEPSKRYFPKFYAAQEALPELEKAANAFDIIADMLDPDKPGSWKLELKRNVRGSPDDHYGGYNHWVALEYFELLHELKREGARSPAKEARRRLLKKWKWDDNTLRRALRWWRKHGLTFKP